MEESRIKSIFTEGKAFVPYIMGGDPNIELSRRVGEAVAESGADILELGIPFTDPIADGQTIQEASVRALIANIKPSDVLELACHIRKKYDVPIVLMTYFNLVYSCGPQIFMERARKKGVEGMIIPDMPVEEAKQIIRLGRRNHMDIILLAAPTTPERRLRMIAKNTSGFLYLVSLLGVTGERNSLGEDAINLISRVKSLTDSLPVAVGFGISKPEHVVSALKAGADGVIVGSAIVRRISRYTEVGEEAMLAEVSEYVKRMKAATKI